jgi:hypothetical protein
VLETGSYEDFIVFSRNDGGNARLQRCFPGKDWDYLGSRGEWLNFSLPGCSLSPSARDFFNKIVSEISSGYYSIHVILCVNGKPFGGRA